MEFRRVLFRSKPKITEKNNTEEEGQVGPKKGKSRTGKGNLKKVAREVGKAEELVHRPWRLQLAQRGVRIQTHLQKGRGDPRREAATRKVRTMLFFAKISLRNQWWLLGSTVGSNDYLGVELPGAWEPPDSSCVGRISPTMESQNYFSFGNKN